MNTVIMLFGLNLAPLYYAIAKVESDLGATADNVYQLRQIYRDDVARICELRNMPAPPAYEKIISMPELSEEAMRVYWEYYGNKFLAKYPRHRITYEYLARVHNGGPLGWAKLSTYRDWFKVQDVMARAHPEEIDAYFQERGAYGNVSK